MISSLVYKRTCGRYKSTYTGKTSRHILTNVSKQIGFSYRTSRALTSPPFSSIRYRTTSSGHENCNITAKQFNIITYAKKDLKVKIKKKHIH